MHITAIDSNQPRMQIAAGALSELGYTVTFAKEDAIPEAGECLLLPIPSRAYCNKEYKGYPLIVGGGIPVGFHNTARACGQKTVDLLDNPHFVEENARLTAEAALALGMEASGISYFDSEIDIIGFGRIAQALTRYLLALGARVNVYARREDARQAARLMGANAFPLASLANIRHPYLFNTVPAPLLTTPITSLWTDGVAIELASGNNISLPQGSPVRLIDGGALPGKRLPVSAGRLIAATLDSILTAKDFLL